MCAFNFSDTPASFAHPRRAKGVRLTIGDSEMVDDEVRLGPYSALIIDI
jgi:hypothetical protein